MAHRKLIKHVHEPGHFHEFTFSCYQRRPLLTNDDWRTRLSPHIDKACEQFRFDLVAFVDMPEHVHLLTLPREAEPQFGSFLARVKQPFSAEINGILVANNSQLVEQLTVQERPGKLCFRYWQLARRPRLRSQSVLARGTSRRDRLYSRKPGAEGTVPSHRRLAVVVDSVLSNRSAEAAVPRAALRAWLSA